MSDNKIFPDWPADSKDLENIPLNTAEFIFEEASKRLTDSLKAGDILQDKAYKFVGWIIVLFSAIFIFLLKSIAEDGFKTDVIGMTIFSTIYLLILGVIFYKAIIPYKFYASGTTPDLLVKSDLIVKAENEDDDVVYKLILFRQIKSYQNKIIKSRDSNHENGSLIKLGVFLFYIFPILTLGVHLILLCVN